MSVWEIVLVVVGLLVIGLFWAARMWESHDRRQREQRDAEVKALQDIAAALGRMAEGK